MSTKLDLLRAPEDRRTYSVGHSCHLLQVLPDGLADLMEELEIQFASEMDNVGFLASSDLLAISDRVNELADRRRTSAERN